MCGELLRIIPSQLISLVAAAVTFILYGLPVHLVPDKAVSLCGAATTVLSR